MATYGKLREFQPETEHIAAYLERVEVFYKANDIAEDKQVAVFLSVVGGKTFSLLRDLLAPDKPQDKTLAVLFETLKRHFEPKPLVIAERFYFHKRNQGPTESIAEYSIFHFRSNSPFPYAQSRNRTDCSYLFIAKGGKFKMSRSAEPGRKRAYSVDIRWRVVYQRIGLDLHFSAIAKRLNLATSTAHRIYQQFERTGGVESVHHRPRPEQRVLDEQTELAVIGLIMETPTLYLEELCKEVQFLTSIVVSPPTICRLLRRYGMSRKRVRQVALQRSAILRGAFMAHCSLFSRDKFVWLDETGADARDHVRKYGYAIRGMRPVTHRFINRGVRVNAIAALSREGTIALELVSGSVNGVKFFDFVRSTLIPAMMPFDGINSRSILVMDNCSIHHVHEVRDVLLHAGIVTLFLPPYSPDMNPAEEAFSYVKGYLKKHDQLLQTGIPLQYIIQGGFESITEDHCKSWITDCGYRQ